MVVEAQEAATTEAAEDPTTRITERSPERARSKAAKRTRAEWKAALGGRFMNDSLSEAKVVGLVGSARLFHAFSDILTTNLEAGVTLETGSTQQLFTDEFRPQQALSLTEARVNFLPARWFKLYLGALDQSHHGSPIFISSKTFPAVLEYFTIPGLGRWQVSANAQQAVPTSQTFSTRSIGKEPSPMLYTGNLRVGYRHLGVFEATARGTYFTFRNLTRGLAQDGRFYGNTVLGTGAEGARFFYLYEGVEAGVDTTIHFSPTWKLSLGNSYVNNSKAPRPKNRAQYVFGGVRYAGERFHVMPQFGWLRAESDASPAYYTSRVFAHNNRKGYTAGLQVRLVPERIVFDALYVKSKVIEVTPVQVDRTYVEVKLSTEYMSF